MGARWFAIDTLLQGGSLCQDPLSLEHLMETFLREEGSFLLTYVELCLRRFLCQTDRRGAKGGKGNILSSTCLFVFWGQRREYYRLASSQKAYVFKVISSILGHCLPLLPFLKLQKCLTVALNTSRVRP